MSCTPKAKGNQNDIPREEPIDQGKRGERGREQFFQHYPKSNFPIRNVTKKVEPHVEIGAENFLWKCYQPNIRGLCNNMEKYLFLCTTCKNPALRAKTYYGKRFMVGYIQVDSKIIVHDPDQWAVKGTLHLVPFTPELDYDALGLQRCRGMQTFDEETTARLLDIIHAEEEENPGYVDEYLKELFDQEKQARQTTPLPIDEECLDDDCPFRDKCPR